eukprot:scaffold22868_cov23-Cyclotella_meneghiniana.AAC.1
MERVTPPRVNSKKVTRPAKSPRRRYSRTASPRRQSSSAADSGDIRDGVARVSDGHRAAGYLEAAGHDVGSGVGRV